MNLSYLALRVARSRQRPNGVLLPWLVSPTEGEEGEPSRIDALTPTGVGAAPTPRLAAIPRNLVGTLT